MSRRFLRASRRPRRLSWVLVAGIEMTVILTVLVSGFLVQSLVRNSLYSQGFREVELFVKGSATKLSLEHRSHPKQPAFEGLADLGLTGSKYLLVLNRQGKIVASAGRAPQTFLKNRWRDVPSPGVIEYGDTPYLFASSPLKLPKQSFTLMYIERQSQTASVLSTLQVALILGGIVLVFSSLAAITLVVRRVTEPLRKLEEISRTVTFDDPLSPTEIVETRLSEVASLSRSFNLMLERLRVAQRRERDFIGNAAHSLRTPIQIIQGSLHALSSNLADQPEAVKRDLKMLTRESRTMGTLVERLLQLSSAEADNVASLQQIDVPAFFSASGANLRDSCMHHPLVFETSQLLNPQVTTDPVLLEAIVRILVENADAYAFPDSTITVFAESREGGSKVHIGVRNQGPPIPPDVQRSIFERFYRSRQNPAGGDHYGLGLAIADSLVKRIGGRWVVASDEVETAFRVELGAGST